MMKAYTRTITITGEQIPLALIDDLKVFHALPPYDGGSNISAHDGYFGASLNKKYGEDMVNAAEQIVIKPLRDAYTQAIAEVNRQFSRK